MGEDWRYPMELISYQKVLYRRHDRGSVGSYQTLGTLSIVEYEGKKCIEWHPYDISIESDDQEWAMVQETKSQTENSDDFGKNNKGPEVRIPIQNITDYKATDDQTYIISVSRSKYVFEFQNGNAFSFLEFLEKYTSIPLYKKSSNSYADKSGMELQILDRPLANLDIFSDDHTIIGHMRRFWKSFLENPYETIRAPLAQFTNIFIYTLPDDYRDYLTRRLAGDEDADITISGGDYELIMQSIPLPPRCMPPRGKPLTEEVFRTFFDESGRITNPEEVKNIIFHGGISEKGNLRQEVWKYLLDYYPWDSTFQERETLREEKAKEYFTMKSQWETMTADQIERFSAYKERKSLTEKDVHRTDRNIDFYAGEDNPNLVRLQDILLTYVMYNFDLGYVQGMSDLLSPLLATLNDEVDAFWCFVGFLNRLGGNFDYNQKTIKEQLCSLHLILHVVEPELASYLEGFDSGHLLFCFRWVLIWFKREFSYEDIAVLWEILWTGVPCKNYHLLLCIAILASEKEMLIREDSELIDVLSHINNLSNNINLEAILRIAEGIYIQISSASSVPVPVRDILGLNNT